jgi:proton glutamate symport protein
LHPLDLNFGQQMVMMLTSKGVAGVPCAAPRRRSWPARWPAFSYMARTSVNVLGNCLATAVVARWEGVRL